MMRSMKKRLRDISKKREWALKEAGLEAKAFTEKLPIPAVVRATTNSYMYSSWALGAQFVRSGETITILDVLPRVCSDYSPTSVVTVLCLTPRGVGYLNFDRARGPIAESLIRFFSSIDT